MRCKGCDRILKFFKYSDRSRKWTELCGVCSEESRLNAFMPGKFNDYPEDRVVTTWDYSRGPRPECLDWTDSQVLEYIYKALGLADDFDVLKQLVGDIDVELRKQQDQPT